MKTRRSTRCGRKNMGQDEEQGEKEMMELEEEKKEAKKKVSEKVKEEEKKVEVSRAGDGDECGEK